MARKVTAPAITSDNSADAAGALNLYCRHYHSGQWTVLYRIGCETDAYSPGDRENPTPSERPFYRALKSGALHAEDVLRSIRRAVRKSGYADCTCRDCMEIVVTGPGNSGLCHDCEIYGCEELGNAECCKAYAEDAADSAE